MKITHIYTGPDGQSHLRELDIPTTFDELSKRNSTGLLPSTGGGIAETSALPEPRGFHNAPRRQFVAVLKGGLEMETGDGTKITVLPGEVFLADDLTGQGHKTRDLDVPTRVLYIYVPDDFDPNAWQVST
jgi:hypothetical protein